VTQAVASAPGKVVLCGEYAVLDGAPAICMAVDRRARARVQSFDGDWHRVVAPGYSAVEGRFVAGSGSVQWLRGEDEFSLVGAVFDCVRPESQAKLSIELDTREFQDRETGKKLGLGSSAALTVALVAAMRRKTDVLGDSIDVHRRWQHGAGSGVDIAAAVHGGLIEYRIDGPAIAPLSWPRGVHCRLLWSGTPSDTQEKLARFTAAGHHDSRRLLASAAHDMAEAWRSGTDVMQAFPAYIETLRRFSVDHDLGIFDAGHDQLAADAEMAGLVYKPCGAGGGDIGVLFGTSDSELDDFVATGRRVLDGALEPLGVHLEQH
jgi:phosphomevalonate kinase